MLFSATFFFIERLHYSNICNISYRPYQILGYRNRFGCLLSINGTVFCCEILIVRKPY
ncbi:hypothetical protein D3C80_1690280 [compost metagenome]